MWQVLHSLADAHSSASMKRAAHGRCTGHGHMRSCSSLPASERAVSSYLLTETALIGICRCCSCNRPHRFDPMATCRGSCAFRSTPWKNHSRRRQKRLIWRRSRKGQAEAGGVPSGERACRTGAMASGPVLHWQAMHGTAGMCWQLAGNLARRQPWPWGGMRRKTKCHLSCKDCTCKRGGLLHLQGE